MAKYNSLAQMEQFDFKIHQNVDDKSLNDLINKKEVD